MSAEVKNKTPEPGDRALWIRFRAFGDVLQDAAEVCNLKRRFPDVHLTFLSLPEYSEMLRAQPYIDEVLPGYKKPFSRWRETLRNIRAGRYQWLINTHKGGKSSLLSLFSGVEHRVGSASLFCFKQSHHLSLKHWAQLCGMDLSDRSRPSIFAAEEDRKTARNLLAHLPERKLFAVIGASRDYRIWPEEGWIEFLRPLADQGWGIVLNGHGPTEEAIGRRIEDALASGNVLNLVGALDFKKMSGVALACTLAIGNDTGPLHLTTLGGVPTMGLFSRPAQHAAELLLNAPWYRELRAEDYVGAGSDAPPLKKLPAAPVAKAFASFADEFLPRAFAWRGGPAALETKAGERAIGFANTNAKELSR